ncbi:MAG: hypothetical protein SGILL_009747, partial [Bacillariaceae sp.]
KKRSHESTDEDGEAIAANDAKKPRLDDDNGHSELEEAASHDQKVAATSSEEKMITEELNDGDEAKIDEPLVANADKDKETKVEESVPPSTEIAIQPKEEIAAAVASESKEDEAKVETLKETTAMDEDKNEPKENEATKSAQAVTLLASMVSTDGDKMVMKKNGSPKTEEKIVPSADNMPTGEERSKSPVSKEDNADNKEGEEVKLSKRQKRKRMDPKVLDIRKRIHMACRDNDLSAAMEAYEEAVAGGIRFEPHSYYSLLHLCAGFQRRATIHVGTPKLSTKKKLESRINKSSASNGDNGQGDTTDKAESVPSTEPKQIPLETRMEYAIKVRDRMKEENLALNDTAYTAMIKLLSQRRRFEEAERMVEESESIQQCKSKLRLYTPLLIAYCEANQMLDALRVWKRMRNQDPPLDLTEVEYLAFMKCAISTGDALIFENALSELADVVAVPCKDTVAAIIAWFEITHSQHTENLTERTADSTTVSQILEEIAKTYPLEPPPSMGPVVNTDGWQISSACHINSENGALVEGCLKGLKLKQVPLTDRAFQELSKMNQTIMFDGKLAGDNRQFLGGGKGKKRYDFDPKQRRNEFNKFLAFLDRKEKERGTTKPFDVVVDGANIGYLGQNFAAAPPHVDYDQIDWVVRHLLEEKKQRVLLVMHSRHFSPKLLPDAYRPMVDSWMKKGILYKTPPSMNDDWFWIHAALKYRLLIVSNDEMRDHHFQMLSPRYFVRWIERYYIRFSFGIEDGLVVPLAKRGDDNRYLDGYHFASEDEPKEETYLCIRPKVPEGGKGKDEGDKDEARES